MTLIIPGVQVSVVKDVVPQQLAPSGILGIVGLTEPPVKPDTRVVQRASSWSRFRELFGPGTAYSIPEARQALDNGVNELVIARVESSGARASARVPVAGAPDATAFTLRARAPGTWANGLAIKITSRSNSFDLEIQRPGGTETELFRQLSTDPGSDRYVVKALADAAISTVASCEVPDAGIGWPAARDDYALADGADASASDYRQALQALADEPDVDMVLAAVQDFSDPGRVMSIYGDVISHCDVLSKEAKGRIGLGQTAPITSSNDKMEPRVEMAQNLVSDRFVLLAPSGVVGAVAGMIGNLPYFHSPTFKRVAGLGQLATPLRVDDQRALLKGHVVPVAVEPSKGLVVLRGITTDGDQINVRRVADHAVRGVKMLGDLFIGALNNEDGRNALKQKLAEFLLQMQKEGAIVPSTDKTDPAFKVDVYASQADFALGIVRIELAVRPVRAIDFIYATILIQT